MGDEGLKVASGTVVYTMILAHSQKLKSLQHHT
jgi:hypothetical protein